MTLRLGFAGDPGNAGAIAVFADEVPIGFIDIPTKPRIKGGGEMVDGRKLASRIRGYLLQHRGAHIWAAIERVQAIAGDKDGKRLGNATGGFRFGQADGVLRTALEVVLGVDLIEIEPQTWKRHFGLIGTEKDAARLLALTIYPGLAEELKTKGKGGARADALLVGHYVHQTERFSEAA